MNRVVAPVVFWSEPIKGSRFRATVLPVQDADEASAALAEVRRGDPDATHHCWALRLASGGVRASDDGEPSGTAGRPILARLEGRDVVDALVVVSRWYGGTKLGAGGLVRAYGRTAGDALDRAELAAWEVRVEVVLRADYADDGVIARILGDRPCEVEYGARVIRRLTLPQDERDGLVAALLDATAARVEVG